MNRWLRIVCSAIAVSGMCLPAFAGDAPSTAPKAGSVTALLPTAHVSRVVNKAPVTKDAAKGDDVYWNDTVRTEKGGRARITLTDQSILSVGSQAELHIIKHDAKTQQTQLELTYGKIRAEVTTVTKDGGGFEVKTPTAVAGVIGTVFGTESTVGETKFLCISGLVNIRSANPSIPGTTSCEAGKVVTVGANKAAVKRNATLDEYQQFYADTEPATINGLWPWSAAPGTTLQVKANGQHLDGMAAVTSSDPAVAVTLIQPPPAPANAPPVYNISLHVVIAADAKPGPYVLYFKKPEGTPSSAVFMVQGPPGSMDDLDSMLNTYLAQIDEQKEAALSALSTVQTQVQQTADIANGQLATANTAAKPAQDLTVSGSNIQNQAGAITSGVTQAQGQAAAAADAAKKSFTTLFNTAVTTLQTRNTSGKPDDQFKSQVASSFTEVSTAFSKTIDGFVDTLEQQEATLAQAIAQLEQAQMATIVAATPVGVIPSQTVEQGFGANFAAGALATGGPVSWQICQASYKPAAYGVPIPATTPGCTALPGYVSNAAAFAVNSCDLKPAIYAVRFTNGATAYETSLRVIAPAYDDPVTRLQGLALSYSERSPDIFMEYFDPENFPGYGQLQENIRRTMENLSTMNIHILVDDTAINCNEASVRAEWQENYSFLQDPTHIQHLNPQQMTVKFIRTPGKGWFITELNGDNGTVQGLPPGPTLTDAPAAQLSVLNVNVSLASTTAARTVAASSTPTVPLGPVTFTATVNNTGTADVTLPVAVQFFLLDHSGHQIDVVNTTLAPPLAAGKSNTVSATLNIPTTVPGGTFLTVGVRVNPGCTVPVQICDASNLFRIEVEVGAIDLTVKTLAAALPLVGTEVGTINVTIDNVGKQASVASTGNLLLTSPLFSGSVKANIPAIAAGGNAVIAIPIPALPNITGAETFTATISPADTGDIDSKDKTLTASIPVATAVDIAVVGMTPTSSLIGDTAATFNVTLKNLGAATSTASTGDLEVGPVNGSFTPLGFANIPAIGPGTTVTVPVTFLLPNLTGTNSFEAAIKTPILDDTNPGNDTLTATFAVTTGVDIAVISIGSTTSLVEGQPATMTVTLKNLGGATSTATTGNLIFTGPSGPALATGNIPAIAPGASTTISLPVTLPTLSGATNFTATISPAVPNDINTANDTLTQSLTLQAAVDIDVVSIGSTGSLVEGQPDTMTVTLKNLGAATSTATTGNLLLSTPSGALATGNIPAIGPGATAVISLPVTLPVASGPTNFTAKISPAVPLDTNASNDTLTQSLTLLTAVDIQVVSLTDTSVLIEKDPTTFTVTLKNNGLVTSTATTGNLLLSGPSGPPLGTANIPAIASGASVAIPITVTLPALSGANNFTAAINPAVPLDINPANDTLTASFNITANFVDLKMTTLSLTTTAPLTSGSTYGFSITVQNNGNIASSASDTLVCGATGPNFSGSVSLPLSITTVPSIAANGATTVLAPTFVLPKNLAGADTLTCTAAGDPNEPSSLLGDNSKTVGAAVNYNLNLHFNGTLVAPAALQMGSATTMNVTVQDDGPDNAPANYTLKALMNGVNVGNLAGTAITAGGTQAFSVPITVPQIGAAPQDDSGINGQVQIIDGTGLTETNPYDNSISTSTYRLLDFAMLTSRAGLIAVQGRTLTGTAFTVQPTTYLGLFPSFSLSVGGTIPTGLTLTTAGALTGTVTQAPGSFGSSFSGTSAGVTHAASVGLTIVVNPEISLTETSTPALVQGGAAAAIAGTINGGVPNITVSLPATAPTGITIIGASPVTVADGTTVSWNLQASATAPLGGATLNLTATDAGISTGTETVPAGNVTLKPAFSVGGIPNFAFQSAIFTGHGAGPYNGATALQYNEAAQMTVVVKNTGDADPPAGSTVTVTMSCNGSCGVTGSSTGAAPTRATPTTLTFSVNKVVDNPGLGYNGTATITSSTTELTTTDNTTTLTWDVVDFNVVEQGGWPSTQNMQLGKTSNIDFNITEAGGSAVFSVPVKVTAGVSSIGLPATANFPPAAGAFYTANIVVPAGAPLVGDTITFTGTNYGVTRSFSQPTNYYTASLVSTTLFSNSSSQPLKVPLNNTTGDTLELQMKGNYVEPSGSSGATLTTNITAAPFMTFNLGLTTVLPGDDIGVLVADGTANTLAAPGALLINAAIPGTVPQDTITYQLWVFPTGSSNLAVTNIAPSAGNTVNSNIPWVSGDAVPFDITVANNGTANSTGGESLQVLFSNKNVGSNVLVGTSSLPVIAKGGSTVVTLTLVAPDGNLAAVSNLIGNIQQDPPSTATTSFTSTVFDTSNWGVFITGQGVSDANPLPVPAPTGAPGNVTTYQMIILQYGGGIFRNAPTLSGGVVDQAFTQTITPTSSTAGNVAEAITKTPAVTDFYVGQLTAQNGSVTRQATIHINYTGSGAAQAITLVSSDNNVAPIGNTPPAVVQINGYVVESLNLTGNRTTGTNCTATQTECYFTLTLSPDNTATSVGGNGEGAFMNYGASTAFDFTGTLNSATGTLTPGAGTVTASITGAQTSSTKVGPKADSTNPGPIGNQQWGVAFNVGDLNVTFPSCVSVPPGTNLAIPLSWTPVNGFNAPKVSFSWVDSSGVTLIPTSTISPDTGTVAPTGSTTFTVTNSSTGTNPSAVTYYFELTLYNSQGAAGPAPKYFPVTFDLTATGGYCGATTPTATRHGGGGDGTKRGTTAPQLKAVVINGVYGKDHLASLSAAGKKAALPDLQIAASNVSFTPALPKAGDTVEVRFRMTNAGTADAKQVPMALQVNGATVVTDTFDLKAGTSSLGALRWTIGSQPLPRSSTGSTAAQLAVDPQHTVAQASTIGKTAVLQHFALATPIATTMAAASKLVHLQVAEAGCMGFRFAAGAGGSCGSADIELSVEDLANGKYVLNGRNGVADLGVGTTDASNASFGSEALVVIGHTYAVQLPGKNVGLFTVQRVNNPRQLSEKSDRLFNHTKTLPLGKGSGAASTGDVSGGAGKHAEALVTFDVLYSTQ